MQYETTMAQIGNNTGIPVPSEGARHLGGVREDGGDAGAAGGEGGCRAGRLIRDSQASAPKGDYGA